MALPFMGIGVGWVERVLKTPPFLFYPGETQQLAPLWELLGFAFLLQGPNWILDPALPNL